MGSKFPTRTIYEIIKGVLKRYLSISLYLPDVN